MHVSVRSDFYTISCCYLFAHFHSYARLLGICANKICNKFWFWAVCSLRMRYICYRLLCVWVFSFYSSSDSFVISDFVLALFVSYWQQKKCAFIHSAQIIFFSLLRFCCWISIALFNGYISFRGKCCSVYGFEGLIYTFSYFFCFSFRRFRSNAATWKWFWCANAHVIVGNVFYIWYLCARACVHWGTRFTHLFPIARYYFLLRFAKARLLSAHRCCVVVFFFFCFLFLSSSTRSNRQIIFLKLISN